LWQDGLLDVKGVTENIRRNTKPTPKEALFSTYFPKLSFALEHFLANSDDVRYSANANPKSLETISQRYKTTLNGGKGGFVEGAGEFNVIYLHITNGNYTEDFLLSSISSELRARWKEFQETRKLYQSTIELVEKTLEHFLANSDEVKYSPDANPKSLISVIRRYKTTSNDGMGDIVNSQGDCNAIYQHIKSENYSQEFVLSSINPDLGARWKEFQDTRKLRTSDVELIERTLEHFLANSDEVKYLHDTKPRPLQTIIQKYKTTVNDGRGEFVRNGGDCDNIYRHIRKGNYSKEFLLSSISQDLRIRWKEFQESKELRPSIIELVEKTLEHFLANTNKVKYYRKEPRSLKNILQRYKAAPNNGKRNFSKSETGDCNTIYSHLERGEYPEEFLFSSVSPDLKTRWEKYQSSGLQK